MRIVEVYSHLNGLEFILVHQKTAWDEIRSIVQSVDATSCRTKRSKEKTKQGKTLYSPVKMNAEFKSRFERADWEQSRTTYWVTANLELIRKTVNLPSIEQKHEIEAAGGQALRTYNQTDFVKNRIAVEVQFGKYAFVAFDLFVKHMAFFVGDLIDVGVEILPMKELTQEMSSGVAYYERELYNVIRQGRGVPAVPLVLVGIAP
jgi:hypothetical protein